MEQFPPEDPAWSLLDAFDAVTNGMENPEAMKKAEALADPALIPWKLLVRAIASLYGGNTDQSLSAAEAIPEDSAPAGLKPVFRAWALRRRGNGEEKLFTLLTGCGKPAAELFRRLLIEPHPLSLTAEQAEEALRQGLEEQFFSLSGRVLSSLKEQSPFLAFRYGVYCLNLANSGETENGGSGFFQFLQKSLGERDALGVLGFALAGRDNRAAAAALDNALKIPLPKQDGIFLCEKNTGPVRILAQLLESQSPRENPPPNPDRGGTSPPDKKRTNRRRFGGGAQLDLFPEHPEETAETAEMEDPPPRAEREGPPPDPLLQREKLLPSLKNRLTEEEYILMERSLRPPLSFDDLARELPPAARYLGPGVWIKAIKDSFGPV
jgi:hypothetical protein